MGEATPCRTRWPFAFCFPAKGGHHGNFFGKLSLAYDHMIISSWGHIIIGSYDPMIVWSYDHIIIWSYDRMIIWCHDHMIIWSYDHMMSWSYDHMIIWSCDHMIIWSYDHMIIWAYDHTIMRSTKTSENQLFQHENIDCWGSFETCFGKVSGQSELSSGGKRLIKFLRTFWKCLIFLVSKNEMSGIARNAFWQSLRPIEAKFEG